MTDELTGVPNRRAVLTYLGDRLQQNDALPCSILVIDIDHFKVINDQHGHPVGDVTLQQFTTTLRAAAAEPAFWLQDESSPAPPAAAASRSTL